MTYDASYYYRFLPLAEERAAERDRLTFKGRSRERKALRRRMGRAQMLFIGLALALVLVVAFVAAARWLRRKRVREAKRDETLRACASEPPGETIFVCVASYRTVDAAHLLRSLFARARCPSRVYVGLLHTSDPALGDTDVIGAYTTLAHKWNDPLVLTDHVRLLRQNLPRATGAYDSRRQVYAQLYRAERYVLQLRADAVVSDDWDRILIEELKACGSSRAVLSAIPPPYYVEERHAHATQDPAPPSFLCASTSDEMGLPVHTARVASGRPTKPMPSIAWSPLFSFARAEWTSVLPTKLSTQFLSKAAEALLVYQAMWTSGWDAYSPTKIPVYVAPEHVDRAKPIQDAEHGSRVRELSLQTNRMLWERLARRDPLLCGNERTVDDFLRHCGIKLDGRLATVSAKLGIREDANTDEILDKYGSMQEYTSSLNVQGGRTIHSAGALP